MWPGTPSITRTWQKQTGSDPWQDIGSYADNDTIGTTQGNVSLDDIGYRFRLKDVNNDTGQIVYSAPTSALASALSNDTSLASLTIDGNAASPGDTITLAPGDTSVAVVATPTNAHASAAVSGDSGLTTGNNTLTITVTAEDGSTQDYTVTLTVPAVSSATVTFQRGYQVGDLITVGYQTGFDPVVLEVIDFNLGGSAAPGHYVLDIAGATPGSDTDPAIAAFDVAGSIAWIAGGNAPGFVLVGTVSQTDTSLIWTAANPALTTNNGLFV